MSAITAALIDTITTKRASLPLWQARSGVADALLAVAESLTSLPRSSAKVVASAVVSGLAFAVSKEVHDIARERSLVALGKWLAVLEALPEDVKAVLVNGLGQSAKGVAEQFIACLTLAVASVDLRTQLVPLIPALVSIAKAPAIPTVRCIGKLSAHELVDVTISACLC